MTKILLNLRISPELKRLAEEAAKEQNTSVTKLLEEGLRLRLAVPPGTLEAVEGMAFDLMIPVARILVHKAVARVAWEAAWQKVFGSSAPSAGREFRFKENRLVTGDELFNDLFQEFVSELEQAKAKMEDVGDARPFLTYGEAESILQGDKPKN